jgi:hypothetical protein
VTWLRDSHGLFDYESRNINKKNLKTQSQGKLMRVNNDIEYVSLHKKEEDIIGVTPEPAKPVLLLKQEHSTLLFSMSSLIYDAYRWIFY